MTSSRPSPRLSRISILYLAVSAVASVHASSLFPRQAATCGGNDALQQCGSTFPSSFCCPKDTKCMSLNSATVQSVICCPTGQDCAFIQTITCDINQLNATLHPDNQMHLSDTTDIELPKCGDKCCPIGYTCNGGMCTKDTTTPSATTSPTSTSRPTPSSTTPASASQTSGCLPPANTSSQQSFDGKSFAAGLFPGLVIGALSTLALLWLIRKRRDSQSKSRYSGDFGHVARQISDPIYDPLHAARTDFMRRGSSSAQPSPNSTDRIVRGMQENKNNNNNNIHGLTPRIKSMWDRTPKLNFGFNTSPGLPSTPAPIHPYGAAPAIRAGNPKRDPYATPAQKPKRIHSSPRRTPSSSRRYTPQQQLQPQRPDPSRLNSTETIDVLMPAPGFLEPPKFPAMREHRNTSDTTFTKLMERAGFDEQGRGEVRAWGASGGTRI
ncbi:hypothetical protein NX059_007180 [Plenodomus lindquistii]|nr:hypothetical protein NX059_007180 [Plenodomus lindquistii]